MHQTPKSPISDCLEVHGPDTMLSRLTMRKRSACMTRLCQQAQCSPVEDSTPSRPCHSQVAQQQTLGLVAGVDGLLIMLGRTVQCLRAWEYIGEEDPLPPLPERAWSPLFISRYWTHAHQNVLSFFFLSLSSFPLALFYLFVLQFLWIAFFGVLV